MNDWMRILEDRREQYLDELVDFLKIESISSLPEHADDVRSAGEWVAERLRRTGLEGVTVMPTGGHPVVTGHWKHAPGKPTILVYGHFDVQPVDPIDLWDSPPFDPRIETGRIYARGASDDKGNMLIPILAIEALLAAKGGLPVNLKVLFESEEEIGSPSIGRFLAAERERFACDMVLSADAGQFSEEDPALLISLRGLAAIEIEVKGPNRDLHSGGFGGVISNPVHALSHILDSMRLADGSIVVEGFFDDVTPLSDEEREHIASIPFDEKSYLKDLGVSETFGEPSYSTLERAWARPTLEVNGIWGGFQGDGVKTVIPAKAGAKITCRLVPEQRPEAIAATVAEHARSHAPPGVTVDVTVHQSSANPYFIPYDHPGNIAARDVLSAMYGREPLYIRNGGSIPICDVFQQELSASTVSFGFALEDERQHAPNEFFRLASFRRGQEAWCRLLERLGE